MNILIWLVLGGLIGWAASTLLRMREGIPLNVIVGIVGAVLGGWFLSPFVGVSTINQGNFSVPGLIVSFLGAVILLLIVNFVRRATLW
ncbi:MAG TPA: GlsB/YeaQ/YmgE family stress response membrane protein [Steroidobacteraceae bacterium]